ncbi:MAG: alpha/beta hydrolase-fold protein [Actinomycetota bacterium]|jgi:predicted esterase
MAQTMSRRSFLLGVGAGGAAIVAGGVALKSRGDGESPGPVPEAPVGDERVERRTSAARGKDVDFYTAVPAGHGDGKGLPVCLVLHGSSATAAEFDDFGFGRFLTDAVQRGAPPFVLAGATGGVLRWQPNGHDDPRAMVHDEVPAWCGERGFDTSRIALWGWSMGGYGVLRLAETYPGFARAVAAFSPACSRGDAVFQEAGKLKGTPVGLWCGLQDGLITTVRALEQALPEPKAAGAYADGRHTRRYWNRCTPAAFDFLAAALSR